MNELWMDLGYGFLYFNTDKTNLYDALGEFIDKMDSIGCDYDNFGWHQIELRDENGDSIEYFGTGDLKDIGY